MSADSPADAYRRALSNSRARLPTERMVLRRPEMRDIDAIVAIAGDWEVARRLARMPYPYSRSNALFFLNSVVVDELVWAMTLRSSGDVVGVVGLALAEDEAVPELGYYLGRHHWGRGLATEAARAVVNHAFGTLAIAALNSGYFEDNPASGQVLRNLGFVEVGRAERPCLTEGCVKPSVEMMMAASA